MGNSYNMVICSCTIAFENLSCNKFFLVKKRGSSVDQSSNLKVGRHVIYIPAVVYKSSRGKTGSSVDLSTNRISMSRDLSKRGIKEKICTVCGIFVHNKIL